MDVLHLTTLGYDNIGSWSFASDTRMFDLADNIQAVDHFAEDDMLIVQKWGRHRADKELTSCIDSLLKVISLIRGTFGGCYTIGVGSRILINLALVNDGSIQRDKVRTAILKMPGPSCLRLKFSSAKDLTPYMEALPVPSPLRKSPPWIIKSLIYNRCMQLIFE